MAGRFSQQFIDELLARVDIVDLIDARLPLKRSGANYMACCPFHNEKTPSFSVNRAKQFFHCFGCGAHGDAINFLRSFEHLDFAEAVLRLAETAGLQPPEDDAASAAAREEGRLAHRLYDLQAQVAGFYARQLRTHASAPKAVEYLKRRGITGETARRYRLGYAPPGWHNFPPEFDRGELREAGLLISGPASVYDRFRDRIMFPIRDRRGRVVGFGGRVLDDSEPKYLNSPETPVFKKHQQVYGLFEALETRSKIERWLVAEGYMDVIALAQYGFPHAVATLGTATSTDHIELLFRFGDEIVFCFDGDEAGRKAAWKALQIVLPVLPEGQVVRFLTLPAGDDPDSLIRRDGADGFRSRLAKAELLSDYFFNELSRNLSLDSIEGRTQLIKRASPLIETLKPGPFRRMMRNRLGDLAKNQEPSRSPPRRAGSGKPSAPALRPSAHRRLATLLVQQPRLAALLDETARLRVLEAQTSQSLVGRLLTFLQINPDVDSDRILEFFRGTPEERRIAELRATEPMIPDDGIEIEFRDTVKRLLRQSQERRLNELIQRARAGTLDEQGREEIRRLMEKISGDED